MGHPAHRRHGEAAGHDNTFRRESNERLAPFPVPAAFDPAGDPSERSVRQNHRAGMRRNDAHDQAHASARC